MSATALDILRAAREYAADPDHIVTNPRHIYERANGDSVISGDRAERGCLVGIESIVAVRLGTNLYEGGTSLQEAINATTTACGDRGYLGIMRDGHAAILFTYDRAIAALENA